MSTRPQLGTQLGTDSHGCSYAAGRPVTRVPPAAKAQVSDDPGGHFPPHLVDNPGGGAPCRPVDDGHGCAQRPQPGQRPFGDAPGTTEAPVPWGDEGLVQ